MSSACQPPKDEALLDQPPALDPRHVQHQRDPVHDAPADNLPGEIAGLHRAAGEPGESGSRVVGVNGGEGTAVARVERLEQVGGLGAADLADDDVVRPMPQGVFHQVANRHAHHLPAAPGPSFAPEPGQHPLGGRPDRGRLAPEPHTAPT